MQTTMPTIPVTQIMFMLVNDKSPYVFIEPWFIFPAFSSNNSEQDMPLNERSKFRIEKVP